MVGVTVTCPNYDCPNFSLAITTLVPDEPELLATWYGVFCGACGTQLMAGAATPPP